MGNVSIVLSIRQCTGNKEVEVVGECEKKYNELALYAASARIINMAKSCGGELIPWVRESAYQKFCLAFRFGTEENKKEFLRELSTIS